MINPTLKIEVKRQIRPLKLTFAILAQLILSASIFFLLLKANLGKGVVSLMIAESCLAMVISPIFARQVSASEEIRLTPLRSRSIFLGQTLGGMLYPILFIALSLATTTIYMSNKNPNWIVKLFQSHLQLTAIVALFSGLTIFFSQFLGPKYPFSVHISYLIVALLISSTYLSKFFIDRFDNPSQFISVILHLNPIISVSSNFGYDILRNKYLYQLSTIPMYRFAYPPWWSTFFWYTLTSVALFGISFWRFKRSLSGLEK